MNGKLATYLEAIAADRDAIPSDRVRILEEIVDYISSKDEPKLNFICTHNSRRSHLSQIWAQAFAHKFSIPLATFSGGTEATAFNPNAVAALQRAGFDISKKGEYNPRYEVSFDEKAHPVIAFSKRYEDSPNPTRDFAAIMTCSEADAECPVVLGADTRIKLFYQDPKIADGTPNEASTYDERCRQIAKEMFYVFDKINRQKQN